MKNRVTLFAAGALIALIVAGAVIYQQLTAVSATASNDASKASGSIVVDWNKELIHLVGTAGVQPSTVHPTRSFAILHAAIYDAVLAGTEDGTSYLFRLNAPRKARADAAAAEAGHDALLALYPSQKAPLDQVLDGQLATIPDGTAKRQGIEVGHLAAALMVAARAADGSAATPPTQPAGTDPGKWRPAPPLFAPAAFTQCPNVTPFVIPNADQFRSPPPPALDGTVYATDINEVKAIGQNTSTTRTADQTQIAKFWPGPIWITWNQIAETAALAHHSDLVKTARLFALLNLSFADTVIAFYDAKYHYDVWRPISAIRDAGTSNPAVVADPTWTPLLNTANDPSYPGAHSAISAAGDIVLSSFYGEHNILAVTSDSLPGVTRNFNSYSAAATEAGLSRIYGGVHTRADHEAGLTLGHSVAGFVLKKSSSSGFGFLAT